MGFESQKLQLSRVEVYGRDASYAFRQEVEGHIACARHADDVIVGSQVQGAGLSGLVFLTEPEVYRWLAHGDYPRGATKVT